MAKIAFPHLQIYKAHGKTFRYYRRRGLRIRIEAEPGTLEFAQEYEAAKARFVATPKGEKLAPKVAAPGSFRALWEAFRISPEYSAVTLDSRKHYDRSFTPLVEKFGEQMVANMPRSWVLAIRDLHAATPRKANHLVALIRRLMNWAVDHEWRKDNPAVRIGALKTGSGHRAWTDHEIAVMTSEKAGHVAGPVLLALYTAQRLGDVLALPPSAYDGKTLTLTQSKTGTFIIIPVHPVLRAALDATIDPEAETICRTMKGEPWKTDHFKHVFMATRKKLGLPSDMHFHGLRGTAASRMAEGGASDLEIGSMTGHKTGSMVKHYARGARQKMLAEAAVSKMDQAKIEGPNAAKIFPPP